MVDLLRGGWTEVLGFGSLKMVRACRLYSRGRATRRVLIRWIIGMGRLSVQVLMVLCGFGQSILRKVKLLRHQYRRRRDGLTYLILSRYRLYHIVANYV